MALDKDDLVSRIPALRDEVHNLGARLTELADESHYEDLDHAVLAVRIIDHVLEEVTEHGGLGGEIARTPEPALYRRASDLAGRLQQLRSDAESFFADHPNEDLETAITAFEIARGSLHEVVERYEPEH